MRNKALHLIMAVFGLLGFHPVSVSAASSNTNAMTVRFNFTALTQGPTEGVTNATSTNELYKINKFRFTDKDMLIMLASEFNTTFPDGAQLGITTSFRFVVLDKAGNVFLNLSTNLTDTNYVFNAANRGVLVAVGKVSTLPNKGTETLTQPDFTLSYADGKGNHFHFGGLLIFRVNVLAEGGVTILKTGSFTISGSGGGTLFNPRDEKYDKVVLTGPLIATGANLLN